MADVLNINPGELRDTVEFYNTSAVQDDAGGYPASTKTLAFSLPVKVVPKASKSVYEGGKIEYLKTWEVTARYESDRVPNETMLAKNGNDYFTILGIKNVNNMNRVLQITLIKK